MTTKRFNNTKTFNNYKELCSFLNIETVPRGKAKENQLAELRKHYDIVQYKSGRYKITYLTQDTLEYRESVKSGKIQTIDGCEINLKSPNCYRDTGIDDYILLCALTAETETMRDFQILCFHQCSYFYKLLNQGYCGADGLDVMKNTYDTFVLTKANELIEGRLDDKVDYLLEQFEKKGYIIVDRFYRLSNNSTATIESIQPYVDAALKELNYKNEYYACRSQLSRDAYFQKRNELYQKGENTTLVICRKELHIRPLLLPTDDKYPKLRQEEQNKILSRFFHVFRAKLLYDLKTSIRIIPPTDFRTGVQTHSIEQLISEVVEKYCTYEDDNDGLCNLAQFNYYAISNLGDSPGPDTMEEQSEITTVKVG